MSLDTLGVSTVDLRGVASLLGALVYLTLVKQLIMRRFSRFGPVIRVCGASCILSLHDLVFLACCSPHCVDWGHFDIFHAPQKEKKIK